MCEGSVSVDGNPGGPPPNTRAARDAVYCAVKVSYNSPMGMQMKYNPAEKSVQVKQDNGSHLHFKANPGSATANRDGVTRKDSCLAQLLNADMTPCTTNNPAYVQVANANGSSQVLSVATGEVMSMVTKTGAVVPRASYDNQVSVSKDSLGQITSIWSARDGLMEFSRTSTRLTISRYAAVQVTRNARGVARATGTPIKVDSFEWTSPGTMVITNQEAGKEAFVRERIVEGNRVIIVKGKDNERIAISYERNELPGGKWEEIKSVYDTNGSGTTLCERTVKKYTDGGWLVLSRTDGYGTTQAETTSYAYNDQYRVTVESRTDGYYKRYEYDSEGRVTLEASPWVDGDYEKVIRTTYADLRFNDNRPATVTESLMEMDGMESEIKITTYTYEDSAQVNRTTVSTLAAGETEPLVTIRETYGNAPEGYCAYAAGRLKMEQAENGVQRWINYEATSLHGAAWKTTEETRVDGQPISGKSERTVRYIAGDGIVTREEQYVHTGEGWSLIFAEEYEYDGQKRLTKVTRGNGRVSTKMWGCCGPLREVDEDGVSRDYGYNSVRQLVEVIRSVTATTPETITSYTRDSSGRILQTREDIGAMQRSVSSIYDILGRIVSQTDLMGRTTTYSYQNHGLKKVTTLPGGAQEVTEWNKDDSLHYEAKVNTRVVTYEYAPVGDRLRVTRKYEGNQIPGYEETDWNGRSVSTYTAAIGQAGNYYKIAFRQYNTQGQLTESAERGVLTQYEYDSLGEISREILPLNGTPTVLNSRIRDYAYAYEEHADGVYLTKTVTSYNAEGQPLTESHAELASQLSPMLESKAVFTDIYGKVTTEWTEYDGATRRKSYKSIPTSNITAETRLTDGFPVHEKDTTDVMTTRTRTYTANGYTVTETDGRNITTSTQYDMADRMVLFTDGAGNITTTSYDQTTGLPSVVTDAQGRTICYSYHVNGLKMAEYGTAVYPASFFCYDEEGNLTYQKTFRVPGEIITTDPSSRTDGDVTQWEYAWQETGRLLKKTYADGSCVTIRYGDMNRVVSVTNARGQVTSHSYDNATGLLTGISYDDAETPDIQYQYNHLGWLTTVTDGFGTRILIYDFYGKPDTKDMTLLGVNYSLKEIYDGYGRNTGHTLKSGSSNTLLEVMQAYKADGRLSVAGILTAQGLKTFAYSYLGGAHLLSTLTMPGGLSQEIAYEENRNLPTQILYKKNETNLTARTQTYDSLARPSTRTQQRGTETARNDRFFYDSRGELASATLGTKSYAYAYDNIGNRITSAEDAREMAYVTNNLNQYTSVTEGENDPFSPTYDADGNQTQIRTRTGIWAVAYNAVNRPVSFIQGNTVVECGYDYKGRRWYKKVTQNGTVTKHECYLYRDYLQIAALDMLQNAVRHTIVWDPMESIATRPLAFLARWNLYMYGFDFNKNVTELFDDSGEIVTKYDYEPYGEVTETGDITGTNSLQFSSEFHDEETTLIYYNCRTLNVSEGRWNEREPLGETFSKNLYQFVNNSPTLFFDMKGENSMLSPAGAAALQGYIEAGGVLASSSASGGAGAAATTIAVAGGGAVVIGAGLTQQEKIAKSLAKKMSFPIPAALDALRRVKGRKKDWVCVVTGAMQPADKGTKESCCAGWIFGVGADKELKKAKKNAWDNAQTRVKQGCKAKHLTKDDSQCFQM